ncbi:hypothetical protein ACFL59_14455 [Planctomycetota bacterium]
MKRALFGFTVLALLAMVAPGCSTTGAGASIHQTSKPPSLTIETLKRNEYIVLDTVEGKAKFKYSQFFFFFRTQDPASPVYDETLSATRATRPQGIFDIIGGLLSGFLPTRSLKDVQDEAKSRALHDALNKIPDADTLIMPRWDWDWREYDYILGLDIEATVTCRGKAIKIKTGELPYTPLCTHH